MCGCFAGRQKMAILTSLLYYQGGCKAGVSLHIYPEQNFITRLRLLPRAWDENFELINVDSSRCFLKPNDIFKWQLFLSPPPLPLHSNTLWAILLEGGGGGLFTTDESGKYHYLLKTADLMVTTLSLVLCIICLYSICWLKRSLCIAHASFCKEQKIQRRSGLHRAPPKWVFKKYYGIFRFGQLYNPSPP